jgi:hypothetical protein
MKNIIKVEFYLLMMYIQLILLSYEKVEFDIVFFDKLTTLKDLLGRSRIIKVLYYFFSIFFILFSFLFRDVP